MPAVRRLGNRIYRGLINVLADSRIGDPASGMRVLRKDKLWEIYPLPDGLHFTPAMTCRAALDSQLKIIEVPIRYEERSGRSKLSVVRDGLRFLKIIVSIALTYKPLRMIGTPGLILLALAAGFGLATTATYLRAGVVPEGDVYRLISVVAFGTGGFLLLGLAATLDKMTRSFSLYCKKSSPAGRLVRRFFSARPLALLSSALVITAFALNHETIASYVTTGLISTHWSYVALGALLGLLATAGFTFALTDYVIDLAAEKARSRAASCKTGAGGVPE
jgi:hypothetical protein